MEDYDRGALEAHFEEEGWADLAPTRGNVVEVYLAESDWPGQPEVWAAFLVVKVALSLGGGYVLEVKFLGCQEEAVKEEPMSQFDRKAGTVHLCVEKPCLLDDHMLLVSGSSTSRTSIHHIWAVLAEAVHEDCTMH